VSDFTTVANALKAELDSITDIGKTHIGWPLMTNWSEYLAESKFTTGGGKDVIRVWIINRTVLSEIWVTQTQSYSVQTWEITGYLGYADGITTVQTEAESQEFCEFVFKEIRENYNLGNIFDTQEAPELRISLELFGRVACHVARIILRGEIDKTF